MRTMMHIYFYYQLLAIAIFTPHLLASTFISMHADETSTLVYTWMSPVGLRFRCLWYTIPDLRVHIVARAPEPSGCHGCRHLSPSSRSVLWH